MSELASNLFEELPATGNEAWPGWLNALRQQGRVQFEKTGLPNKRTEQWKYTSLFTLEQMNPGLGDARSASKTPVLPEPLAGLASRVSLVDGTLESMHGISTPGLTIASLEDALKDESADIQAVLESLDFDQRGQGFSALNTATLGSGVVIRVEKDVQAGEVLLQWNHHAPDGVALFNSRVVILLGEGASLHLVEQYENTRESCVLNVVIQGRLASKATLTLTRVQQQSSSSFLVNRTDVEQCADSHFQFTAIDLGDGLARHDVKAELSEPGAVCALNGACITRGQSHVDHHLEAAHMARDCRSSQLFRAVADDRSRVVFNGKVHVFEGADGTDASQSSAGLLLSKLAEIDAKPELEIYADEVIASHGATVGQLDEEALFYLRSRGVSRDEARNLLTMAFCRSVTDQLPVEALREPLGDRLTRSLSNGG